ncbi:Hpt domain-containing protein [Azohydromonas lata]|uniref:Hpt domain-containing protein n=1 Tax=Azohydromonas lata TaxID=45677 RepID=A0ABU5I837_9BURK|nr:Hpt domain-containing protein [Azohydromonas lata]MDZ5455248.1 Hpt domain-containing protein [Azohydromonas lata]
MEGIDPTLVRTALQGNFERYVQLCAQFMEQAQAAPEEITAALNSQDAQAALNTLHSVRGAAVSLGMKRLAAAGSHVKEAIRASRASA